MARNRVIHNVQEVFMGSPSGDADWVKDKVAGYEILKRINQVQSFSYDIKVDQDKPGVLGKSASISNDVIAPPEVSVSLDYYLNGIVNERRIGLNVAHDASSHTDREKNAVCYMVDSGRLRDKRDIYLIVNNKNTDVFYEQRTVYTSDFTDPAEQGVTAWQAYNGGTDTLSPPYADVMALAFDADTSSSYHFLHHDALLAPYKKYKITGEIQIASASTNITEVVLMLRDGIYAGASTTTKGAWESFSVEFTNREWAELRLYALKGAVWEFTTDTTDDFYIQNIVVTELNSGSPYSDRLAKNYATLIKADVDDVNASDYGAVIFQNCYLSSYSLNASVGSIPTASLEYNGDNVIMEPSADEKNIAQLNSKTATVEYKDKKFIVPGRFSQDEQDKDSLKTAQSNRMDFSIQRRGKTVYASDFSAGSNGWTGGGHGNVSSPHSVGGEGNAMRLNSISTSDTVHYTKATGAAFILTVGKKYKVTFRSYIPSSAANVTHLRVYDGVDYTLGNFGSTNSTWQSHSLEFTAQRDYISFYMIGPGGTEFEADTTTDFIYFKDIVVTEMDTDGLTFHNEHVQGCNVSFEIGREKISCFGHKSYIDHYPKFPVNNEMSINFIDYQKDKGGSFFSETNGVYDVTLNFKDKNGKVSSSFIISGAGLKSYSAESEISENKSSSISLSCETDLDNHTRGLFMSGRIGGALTDLLGDEAAEPQLLVDEDGNYIESSQVYPQF